MPLPVYTSQILTNCKLARSCVLPNDALRPVPFQAIPFSGPSTRSRRLICYAEERRRSGGRKYDGSNARKSSRGDSMTNKNRRRGRPAWQRSPDDSPLRDGNRDRLMGLLTDRAAKTLLYYYFELNPTLYGWWTAYLRNHEIPKDGSWDDVSGETFLRELMSQQIVTTNWGGTVGVDKMYDATGYLTVDPRNIAQRVMEIRTQIAKEWIEELKAVSEENALLMREVMVSSFSLDNITVAEPGNRAQESTHPEVLGSIDDSAAGSDD